MNGQNQPDAVMDAIMDYAVTSTQYVIANPTMGRPDHYQMQMQQQFYQSLLQTYSSRHTPQEATSLKFIKHELSRLHTNLQPGTLRKIWHHPLIRSIRTYLSGNYGTFNFYRKQIAAVSKKVNDQHNLDTLSEAMTTAGFKHQMEGALVKMINQNLPSFHLTYADAAHQNCNYILYFEKIPATELYYFKQFDIALTPTVQDMLRGQTAAIRLAFPFHKGLDYTATQASALLKGNAVFKSIDGKGTWQTLNKTNPEAPFIKTTFDHIAAIHKLPIPLQKKQSLTDSLASALENGLSKTIPLIVNGETIQCKIAIHPRQKKLIIKDKYDKEIQLDQSIKADTSIAKAQKMASGMEVINTDHTNQHLKPRI